MHGPPMLWIGHKYCQENCQAARYVAPLTFTSLHYFKDCLKSAEYLDSLWGKRNIQDLVKQSFQYIFKNPRQQAIYLPTFFPIY